MSQDGGGDFNGREQFMSSSASLTINVVDQQDTPPSFIGTPYFGFVYEVSLPVSTMPSLAHTIHHVPLGPRSVSKSDRDTS